MAMNILPSLFSLFKKQALITDPQCGCHDVIAVRQPDGSLKADLFHVRFGCL